ncbi:MAG: tRNA dihydrouridine synthase DusB [Oscillospiraceae bacterium]|nr:tRNA dihydrouridine synthase DusB [Oscillospiraceae bacterium]
MYTKFIKIGNVKIKKTAALAPMADVADTAFRVTAKRFGAAYTVGEMTSAKGLTYGARKTAELLEMSETEHPCAVQLFGNEPKVMAKAAVMSLEYSPDIIDINAGCPVNKVVGTGAGSGLMRSPKLFGEVMSAVVNAVGNTTPVTVKIRLGWDADSVNAVEIAKIAQECGVAAVTLHARTRSQFYSGTADWSKIAEVKNSVGIPVIGNGDVDSAEKCSEMYKQTGCDLVMVGRAALGRPWIFREIEAFFETGKVPPPPNLEERLAVMRGHIELAASLKGERIALRESRKQAAWYIKGVRHAAALRSKCMSLETLDDLYRLIEAVLHETV